MGLNNPVGIGMNQTWQNVAGSRVAGTTYTNTTPTPIHVSVEISPVNANAYAILTVNGIAIANGGSSANTGGFSSGVDAIVPPNGTYVLSTSNGAVSVIQNWTELR